jgi:hypothetical protein
MGLRIVTHGKAFAIGSGSMLSPWRKCPSHAEYADSCGNRAPSRGWTTCLYYADNLLSESWFRRCRYCEWISKLSAKTAGFRTEADGKRPAAGERRVRIGDEASKRLNTSVANGRVPSGLVTEAEQFRFRLGHNVHEWCSDWYAEDYYAKSPGKNPTGPAELGVSRAAAHGATRSGLALRAPAVSPAYGYTVKVSGWWQCDAYDAVAK